MATKRRRKRIERSDFYEVVDQLFPIREHWFADCRGVAWVFATQLGVPYLYSEEDSKW